MKLSKIVALGLAALCVTATVFANGGKQADGANTIKVVDNWSETHPMAAAIDNIFKAEVEKNSGGKIKVEVYHSGTLGNEADLWNGVRNGTIEVAIVGTPMNQEFPVMLISDWPFLYRNIEHAKKVWTGPIAEGVNAQFHEKFPTVYLIGWGPNSARTFTSNKKLTTVDDFRGQKFRMPGNPIHVGIAENLGASAQVIPLGELFSALETGVVDGQDNGMVTVISEHLYEVQKYLYETNHIVATLEIVVSAKFLDGLTEDLQKVVRDAAKKASEKAWDDYIVSLDNDRKFLQSKGITVTPCTTADQERIITMIKPLTDKLLSDNASWAPALIEKVKAVK
ncbi:MAG: TRAP transporter substrate-binding protein [Spirochaetaceae bacterium]|jgi:tripartite ATP-independent transporter DctP family solute receptor|nr:TRAP transporter substrate-binding protein [Spirochaetaceae bacterium]